MKFILTIIAFILLGAALFSISCQKELSCEGCNIANKSPIAIAGPDKQISLPTDSILLDGSASSDPDGTLSEWLWTKISGPASFTFARPSDSVTEVKALIVHKPYTIIMRKASFPGRIKSIGPENFVSCANSRHYGLPGLLLRCLSLKSIYCVDNK